MQTVSGNRRKVNRGGLTHLPSPRWRGALNTAVLTLSMLVLISYGLLDWEWQQDFGRWNYVIGFGGILAFAALIRGWHNDPRRSFGIADPDPHGVDREAVGAGGAVAD